MQYLPALLNLEQVFGEVVDNPPIPELHVAESATIVSTPSTTVRNEMVDKAVAHDTVL